MADAANLAEKLWEDFLSKACQKMHSVVKVAEGHREEQAYLHTELICT